MITKRELRDYRNIIKLLESLEGQLAELDEMKSSTQRISNDLTGISKNNKISDPTGRAAEINVRICNLEQELLLKRMEMVERLEKVTNAIYSPKLSILESRILSDYYVRCLKWEQVAIEVKYSINHVWRLHGAALEKLKIKKKL